MSKQTERLCQKVYRISDNAERLLSVYEDSVKAIGSKEWKSIAKVRVIFSDTCDTLINNSVLKKHQLEKLLKKWETVDLNMVYALTRVLKVPKHRDQLVKAETLNAHDDTGLLCMLYDSVCADIEAERKSKQLRANTSNAKAKVLAETITEEQYDDSPSIETTDEGC